MSVFEQRLSFRTLQNAYVGFEVLYVLQWVHGGALARVHEVKLLKNFGGQFTFGEQINSLKYKKLCKLIYFEGWFNANML